MRHTALAALMGSSLLVLAACGSPDPETVDETPTAATDMAETNDVDSTATPAAATPAEIDRSELSSVVNGPWRGDMALRDEWRHPVETLEFFGVDPSGTIVEIWPGAGWYTQILAPWVDANGGTYIAAHFPDTGEGSARERALERYIERFSDTAIYGDIQIAGFDRNVGLQVEPGSADAILTFRNIHNWMARNYAEQAFAEFYEALKPGGIVGVVEHRLPSTREQDPNAGTGYVQESFVIALAEEAGLELVGSSEINANPNDNADHPFGVWTLPPVRRSPTEDDAGVDEFDREAFDAIGESDRMTLLFRKPLAAESADDTETAEDGEE
ncbi:class I SAM-dependent methyltransferase [Maricaulis sp. CAU 1757]